MSIGGNAHLTWSCNVLEIKKKKKKGTSSVSSWRILHVGDAFFGRK